MVFYYLQVATSLSNGELVVRSYKYETPGRIDLGKRSARLLASGIIYFMFPSLHPPLSLEPHNVSFQE